MEKGPGQLAGAPGRRKPGGDSPVGRQTDPAVPPPAARGAPRCGPGDSTRPCCPRTRCWVEAGTRLRPPSHVPQVPPSPPGTPRTPFTLPGHCQRPFPCRPCRRKGQLDPPAATAPRLKYPGLPCAAEKYIEMNYRLEWWWKWGEKGPKKKPPKNHSLTFLLTRKSGCATGGQPRGLRGLCRAAPRRRHGLRASQPAHGAVPAAGHPEPQPPARSPAPGSRHRAPQGNLRCPGSSKSKTCAWRREPRGQLEKSGRRERSPASARVWPIHAVRLLHAEAALGSASSQLCTGPRRKPTGKEHWKGSEELPPALPEAPAFGGVRNLPTQVCSHPPSPAWGGERNHPVPLSRAHPLLQELRAQIPLGLVSRGWRLLYPVWGDSGAF